MPYWRPTAGADAATHAAWETAAYRVALGVEVVAHMEPVLDTDRLAVGLCAASSNLAAALCAAVIREGVAAEVGEAHRGADACDVLLPCRPGAPDEEIDHAVLAAVKSSHALFCSTSPSARRLM